jgi:hypothetical protein
VRERWFGATGQQVPEIAVEGEDDIPLDDALVLDGIDDVGRLEARWSFAQQRPRRSVRRSNARRSPACWFHRSSAICATSTSGS